MFENRPDKIITRHHLPILPAMFLVSALIAGAASGTAQTPGGQTSERPRFVSLKNAEVNMREGPSTEHGVKWIYHRQGLPMQVLAEYDVWRRVRDMDGEIGWIHVSLLSNERGALITGNGYVEVRSGDEADDPVIAEVESGVVARLENCGPDVCRLDFSSVEGWVERARIWGVYADEQF